MGDVRVWVITDHALELTIVNLDNIVKLDNVRTAKKLMKHVIISMNVVEKVHASLTTLKTIRVYVYLTSLLK